MDRGMEESGFERTYKRFQGMGGNNERSKRSRHNGRAQVLQEPVWGDLQVFQQRLSSPGSLQQNHANEKRQTELVEHVVSRGSRTGFQLTETFSWEKAEPNRENREVSQRAQGEKCPVQSIKEMVARRDCQFSRHLPHKGSLGTLTQLLINRHLRLQPSTFVRL